MKHFILDTSYNLSLLSELGKPEIVQPRISQIITSIYENMFGIVMDGELEKESVTVKTRIADKVKNRGLWKGKVFKKNQKVVVTDVIRAGMGPSHRFYLKLTEVVNPKHVRQDHIMSERIVVKHGVCGSKLSGSKIGGSIKNAIVIIPDPMGATGGSVKEVIEYYLKHYGRPKRFVIVNLVVAPQYLKALGKIKVPLSVYAARLDKGLTDDDYIYPGLGGVGEMINNTKK